MPTEQQFLTYLKESALLGEALTLLGWDQLTGMPEDSTDFRAEVTSYLAGKHFDRMTNADMKEFMDYFETHRDELSEFGQQVYDKTKEGYDLNAKIPVEDFTAYQLTLAKAHSAWVNARQTKDFNDFLPVFADIVAYLKKCIPLWRKDEKTPYDVLLNQFEPGITTEKLDRIFSELRDGLIAIRKTLAEKGTTPTTDFLYRHIPKATQSAFSRKIVADLGYNFNKGRLDDTIHPFMTQLNRNDARITTRWDEDNFKMALFGIMHEAGHGMYEQNVSPKFDYTPLTGGTSMGIHESQSLFYEMMVGSDYDYWKTIYPWFQEQVNGVFDDIEFEDFYAAMHESHSSLIRIEADSLTYPLHIIIRYEIEKLIFNEDLPLEEIPRIWNEKYQEYLGITPENDLVGVLQDSHWSGGHIGYFPSYALGYMYAAQLRYAMNKEFDIAETFRNQDYKRILNWLTEHIHQYASSKKPNELILAATGEELNPTYLLERLKEIYYRAYKVTEY